MPPNITLLAGAPFRSDLKWDEQRLTNTLGPEFERIVDYPNAYIGIRFDNAKSSQDESKWRVIVSRIDPQEDSKSESADSTQPREESVVIVRDFADPGEVASQSVPQTTCSPLPIQHDSAISLPTPRLGDQPSEEQVVDEPEDVTVFVDTQSDHAHQVPRQESSLRAYQLDIASDKPGRPPEQDDNYLDHSLAVYEESQPADLSTYSEDETAVEDDSLISYGSTQLTCEDSVGSLGLLESNVSEILVDLPIPPTSLDSLPKVGDLNRIYPQTVTANLIIGVISKQDTRIVRTKRASRLMTLIELLVGDKSGKTLTVTFWLRPDQRSDYSDPFRQRNRSEASLLDTLNGIRNRDILLIRNVALSTYNGVVRGQTLHPSAKTRTSIVMLGRNGRRYTHVDFQGPHGRQASDTALDIENWMQSYLPAAYTDHVGRKGPLSDDDDHDENDGEESLVQLPPDTPR